MHSGEISHERLHHSVRKILELKASLGLNKARLADVSKLSAEMAKPENLAVGQKIADEAITLVRENGKVIPLESFVASGGTPEAALPYQSMTEVSNRLVAVIFSDDLRTESGRMFERQILARVPDARIIYLDARSAAGMKATVVEAVDAAEHVVAAVYVVPTAGKAIRSAGGKLTNTVAMDEATGSLLTTILEHAGSRTVVLAMGNPYVVQDFPAIENYVCAFSNTSCLGNGSRESDLWRHSDRRAFAGYDSGGCSPRRGTRTRCPAGLRVKPATGERSPMFRKIFSRNVIARLSLGALFAALCILPACSVTTNEKSKEGEKQVDIKSPMGDLHVSEAADIRDAGLTLYPGAKPAPKENSDSEKSANVNLSLPGFSLKVVAAEFISDDAPAKINAYLHKELQKYGKPLRVQRRVERRSRGTPRVVTRTTCRSRSLVTKTARGDSALSSKWEPKATSTSYPSSRTAREHVSPWFICACTPARTTRSEVLSD